MNRAMRTALPVDDIIVTNSEVMGEIDEGQVTDENTDSEDELADFVVRIFGQNPAIESTHL